MAGEVARKQDIVVSPGEYLYTQNGTKGTITLHEGPTVVTLSAQDMGVVYNPKTGGFDECNRLEDAKRKSKVLPEGFYCVLLNPAKNRKQPEGSGSQQTTELAIGRKVVISGPAMFALWPGQSAEVIRGHQLRSNQFLRLRVYNEEEARSNWNSAVVKPASKLPPIPASATAEEKAAYELALKAEAETVKVATAPPPKDLTVGRQLVVRGTEVSFYMPPTGVTVEAEGVDEHGKPNYVREALTLERLEYAILKDESGNKRYAYGPSVVFPTPTETFLEGKNDDGHAGRKFRAIELNKIQGLHLKVIADYEENGRKYVKGEELFITGDECTIYYPREEVSAIKYDGKTKHFATAVTSGEGRYVLNRETGKIRVAPGETMLLPDPRTEVIVRRILEDSQCSMWYPGNATALAYNQSLRAALATLPTTRSGLSEGDISRNVREAKTKGGVVGAAAMYLSANAASGYIADSSQVSREQDFVGNEFARASSFTQPRTVTLDSKYQGVPVIKVFTGYAVNVVSVDEKGAMKQRVVKGPASILMEYNETLETIELSTGKPKSTSQMYQSAYLKTDNNPVSDFIDVETSDHVKVMLKLTYQVNFEGDPLKWWTVRNYVKLLCDRVRSLLKGEVRKLNIETFYANSTSILKSIIIGDDKKGMSFAENGMRVTEVEVLGVDIVDAEIRSMLDKLQTQVVKTNIELSQLKRGLEVTKEREAVKVEEAEVRAKTTIRSNELDGELHTSSLASTLVRLANKLQEIEASKKTIAADEQLKDFSFDQELSRQKRAQEQIMALKLQTQERELVALKAEAEAAVTRFSAVDGNFSTALMALSNNETLIQVAKAWNIQSAIGGDSISDAMAKVFAATPLAPLVQALSKTQSLPHSNGSPDKKPTATV